MQLVTQIVLYNTCDEGVCNHWNRIWNGMVEWNMEWTVYTAQSRLNYTYYSLDSYLTAKAL